MKSTEKGTWEPGEYGCTPHALPCVTAARILPACSMKERGLHLSSPCRVFYALGCLMRRQHGDLGNMFHSQDSRELLNGSLFHASGTLLTCVK